MNVFAEKSRKKHNKTRNKPVIEAKPERKEISPASFFGGCKVLKKEQRLPKRKASSEDRVDIEEVNSMILLLSLLYW